MNFKASIVLCMCVNVVVLLVVLFPHVLANSPFAVVEDWADFAKFLFLFWTGSLPK